MHGAQDCLRKYLAASFYLPLDGIGSALADLALSDINAAHPCVSGEGDEGGR